MTTSSWPNSTARLSRRNACGFVEDLLEAFEPRLSFIPRQRQLFAHRRHDLARPQPLRPFVLLSQDQPRPDPNILSEQRPHQTRAVALPAAMQQHDVTWQRL